MFLLCNLFQLMKINEKSPLYGVDLNIYHGNGGKIIYRQFPWHQLEKKPLAQVK